jgi:hypothetical protein
VRGVKIPFFASMGGGAVGLTVWGGTTDPGSNAVEGDFWCKG